MADAGIRMSPIRTSEHCGVTAEANGPESLSDRLGTGAASVDRLVRDHVAVVRRGFTIAGTEEIRQIVTELSGPPLDYTECSSHRSEISTGIRTSTAYQQDKRIFLHNEQSYNLRFPERLFFYCVDAGDKGCETLVADSRRVFSRIPMKIREKFFRTGYRLVRNYLPHLGLPWQEVFQTSDRSEGADYRRANDIDLEWLGEDQLRTSQQRAVIARHPAAGGNRWFNHLTFLHVSTLGKELAGLPFEAYGQHGVSANTFYGDGTPIEPEVLAGLRAIYEDECVAVPWQEGDLLMGLDLDPGSWTHETLDPEDPRTDISWS